LSTPGVPRVSNLVLMGMAANRLIKTSHHTASAMDANCAVRRMQSHDH
jgi:hypothetical protein